MEMSDDSRPTVVDSVQQESVDEMATETQVNERDEEKDESSSFFPIGTVVDVMPRLWPGINKPGGVGRVYGVHYDEEEDCYLYDVQYIVVSGKEERIEERFVKLHVEETGHRSVRGRCKLCGSFIRDCQHTAADIAEHYRKLREAAEEKRLGLKKKKDTTKPNVDEKEESKGYSSSSKVASGSVPHKRSKLNESNAEDNHVSDSSSESDPSSSSSEYNEDSGSSNDEDLIQETTAVKQQSTSASLASDELSALTNEVAKERARSLHRQLYNTCLQGDATEDNVFINNSRNDDTNYLSVEYREAVQSLKTLTLGECMELLRLCHNFIINMRLRAVSPTTSSRSTTLEYQRHQLSMDLAAATSDLRQQQDEDHKLELAERVVTLDEKQEKLFRQIERAGFDIFNKAEKRARSLLKVSVFKKPLKRQIMTLSLAVSDISSSWAEDMKKARVEMIDIADTFADIFGRYAEDVLDGIEASDGETSEDPDDANNDMDNGNDRATVKPSARLDRLRDPVQEAGIKRPRPQSDADSDDEDFEFPRRPTQVQKKVQQRQRQRKLSAAAARWQQRRARLVYGRSLSDDDYEQSDDEQVDSNTIDLTGNDAKAAKATKRASATAVAKKKSVKIFRRKDGQSSSLSSSTTKPTAAAIAWTFDSRISDSALIQTNVELTRRRKRPHRHASFQPSNRSSARTAPTTSKRSASSSSSNRIDDTEMDFDDLTTGNGWEASAIIAWDSDDEQGTVADLSNQLRAYKQRQRRNQQQQQQRQQHSNRLPSGRLNNSTGSNNNNHRSSTDDRGVQDDDYVNLLHQPTSTAKDGKGSKKKPSIRKTCYFRTSVDAVDPTISYDGRIIVLENDQYVGNVVNLNVPVPHRSVVSERIADRLLSCYDTPITRVDHDRDAVSDLDGDDDGGGGDEETDETTAGFRGHRGGGSVSISSYIQQYLARYDSSGRDTSAALMSTTAANGVGEGDGDGDASSPMDKQHTYINFLYDCFTQATTAASQRSSSSTSFVGQDDMPGVFRKIVVRNVVWQLHSCVAQATVFRLEEERLQSQLDQVTSAAQRSSLMTSMVPIFAAQVHEWERQLHSLASFIPAITFSDLQPMFLKTRAASATATTAAAESFFYSEPIHWLHLFLSTSDIEQEISHALLPLLPTHQLAHERTATFPSTIRWIDTLLSIVELNETALTSSLSTSSSSSPSSPWSMDKYAQSLYRLACQLLVTLLQWKLTLIQKLVALLLSSPSYQAAPSSSSGSSSSATATATAAAHTPGHEPVDKQLAQAIKQSFIDLFQVVVFLLYRLLRSPVLSLHLLPLISQRDLSSSSSTSTSSSSGPTAAAASPMAAAHEHVIVNFPLELLLSALHHFGHAQTSLATLKLPAENELTKMITCRWWEIVQTIVLAGDSAWTMTNSQLPSLFWQRLLWQRLSLQGGFQSIPPGNLPSPMSSLALAQQNLPAAWTLWTNPECLWAMLAVLTKYQRLRLQQSRCTNHWTLVHCLCKWNMRVLASSADTLVAPKPLLLKGLLRNIHRLAAIALYWDAGNEALLIFLDLVPQMAALLNQLDTLHVTITAATAAATDDETLPPKSSSNSRAGATGKKTSGYSSSSGGVLASLLQQQHQKQHQQNQQFSSTSDGGDRHFRWMQLTPRVSLLLADHWQRELAQKRRQGGLDSSSASRDQGHPQQSASSSFTWQQARSSLHRYLLQLVTLTFVSYRIPHPLGPLCDALLVAQASHRRKDHTETTAVACDWSVFLHDNDANGGGTSSSSNASHAAAANATTTTLSLWTIESLRMSLKLLLRNITTTVDVATGHHSLSAPLLQRIANFFAPAATVDRWVSIFMAHPHFMSGNLLCLLTKELESGLSMTHVRTRMGLSTKLIDAFIATPLQPMSGADYATIASDLSFTAEDRQRSCLMFFASLLVFNPFPIPTTRLSSTVKPSSSSSSATTTMEWMVNMSREDTTSLAPFLNLVQLVQTMCMHSVLDHGRVTEEVEVLLLASMNISNVVIHHLDLCYVPVHWSTIAAETATATTTSTTPGESLLRSFPDTIFHVSLQLFNTMMQMTTATDTIKIRSKRNVMELSAFAVLFVTSWMRGVHHYVEYLHQEDPTMPGVAAMAASELNKIASLYSTVILQQVQSKVKTLVMSLLRKCRETLETFSAVPSDVTATSGAHKRRRHHQDPSSTTTTSSPSMDTFLYPERLDQLQENASYVFAVSTAKIMVPAVELLGHAVHLGWSLTHAGVLPSSAASSIADNLWQSWYESIDLSLSAGTDMCVGFWMKALLWRQMAQQVASLQQQLTQQCPPHLATVMATDPRYHYARVRQQQMHYTLMSYRRIFVQHLHDILLCLLALEAMPAVKTTMVLEINVETLMKTIVDALQTLNLLTVEPAMPPLTQQWSLHPQCFSRQVPAGAAAVTLGPIHVLVLSTLARYRSAVEASIDTPLGPLPLLHECIQQLLKMKATTVTATAATVGAVTGAQGIASSALPSNFVDHLVQHVYLRVLRFLNLCRFQASEESMRDIDKAVVAVHQPLTQLIAFAENRCFPGDMRVTLMTISLYFSDFVHPYVKHGLTLLKATHLPAQRLGATTTTTAKTARTNEAIDTLPHWQRLLTTELPLLLPSWILLAMSVPFATRCKEWSVLLEVLMVIYHPRMKGLTPYRATIREAFLVEIQALLLNVPSAMLPNDVRAEAVAGNCVSKLHSFGVPVDLTALVVAARQFVGFVFDVQCPLWFRTILSLERTLYENEYDLLRLSEPQVQEVIGQIVEEVRQILSSIAT